MAQAICTLDAASRWAVTGTPIQNKLSDLSTLLTFLRVYPYRERKHFDADISNVWKNGDIEEATKRLKRLAGCLILRRPKDTIKLPSRRDLQCPVKFSVPERQLYQEIRSQAIARITDFLSGGGDLTRSPSYVNVLQQIEAMRMVCNLGLHYYSRHHISASAKPIEDAADWSTIAQHTFNIQHGISLIQCQYCDSLVNITDGLLSDSRNQKQPLFSRCMEFICPECVVQQANIEARCGHDPPCPYASVSLGAVGLEESSGSLLPTGPAATSTSIQLPSKVKALITQLKSLPAGTKR